MFIVPENTTAVLTVTDADLPAQTVTFALVSGGDQAKFAITSAGLLSFKSAPNFEVLTEADGGNVYVVTVQASDGNGRTATQTINVTVTTTQIADWGRRPQRPLRCRRLLSLATLHRFTHRCHILEIKGESYLLQDANRRQRRTSSEARLRPIQNTSATTDVRKGDFSRPAPQFLNALNCLESHIGVARKMRSLASWRGF